MGPVGGRGGCVRRIEVVKMQKKVGGGVRWGVRSGGGGLGVRGQAGCEGRIKVIVKMKKKCRERGPGPVGGGVVRGRVLVGSKVGVGG